MIDIDGDDGEGTLCAIRPVLVVLGLECGDLRTLFKVNERGSVFDLKSLRLGADVGSAITDLRDSLFNFATRYGG